jgi:hypothetical protein
VPPPLQVRAGVHVEPLQLAAAHTVPLAYRRHAPAPSHAPSCPQLAAPSSAHWLSGSAPAGTLMHCPSLPAIAHDRQLPPHAVAQQTPSTQKPDAQSLAAPQGAPGGFGPQLPFTHAAPPTQSALLAQSARQAPPAASHMYGPQESVAVVPHAPAPSQRAAWLTLDPEQDCARQIVPAAYSAQAPVPSQAPLRPQLAMPSSGQSSRGSLPTGMFVHVPTLPSIAHD